MESELQGQAQVWKLMFGFVDSMVIKCAIELRLADIIHSHGTPISLSRLASGIDSPNPDLGYLERIMRYLSRKNVFSTHQQTSDGETLYGLTSTSRLLLSNSIQTLNPLVTVMNHVKLHEPYHCLAQCVKQGGLPFEKAHGIELWEFASQNPSFNNLFQQGMACASNITTKALIEVYKDGFNGVKTLVDVGGGIGEVLVRILEAYPHIEGINFDLPHVISIARKSPRISHVEGDMFESIPNGDAILMKWILHDWGDEDCIKILRNCRRALKETIGKLILVEIVVEKDGDNVFKNTGHATDVVMFALTRGGKERSESEWKRLLEQGGFPRYNIIKLPDLLSIIEAFPV